MKLKEGGGLSHHKAGPVAMKDWQSSFWTGSQLSSSGGFRLVQPGSS